MSELIKVENPVITMTGKLSNERVKQYANDPRMCNINTEIISAFRELLAYREAESEPVAIVETSDRMTFAQLVGTEPRRKAVRELYEGGLVIGQKLYVSPALGQMPIITEQHKAVIESLLKLAYAAWDACDDSEQVNDGVEEYHKIIPRTFDLISDALDELEALPNDQPGFDMQAATQARWALRDILVESASQVLGQTPESINSELLEASQPVVPELGYFAFWPDNGEEVFKKKEDAIAFCKEAIDLYREDAADEGWGDEVRQVYWGVVVQRATEIEVSNEGHVDYVLAPALQDDE